MDSQPVETTTYSLSDALPELQPDRRDGGRHMTLYRVGSFRVNDRRELCLIKNISAGGMMVRAYTPLVEGAELSIELKSGQPIAGHVSWVRDLHAGISFDQPVDVIEMLSATMHGPKPRMPRIEIESFATLRDGAKVLRVRACDISQGGVKIECQASLPRGAEVVVALPGLPPQPAVVCWHEEHFTGVTFNRPLALSELVLWLQGQRDLQRAVG